MWFTQYGRLWDGPWFNPGNGTPLTRIAGIMLLQNLPAATLALEDTTHGSLTIADR